MNPHTASSLHTTSAAARTASAPSLAARVMRLFACPGVIAALMLGGAPAVVMGQAGDGISNLDETSTTTGFAVTGTGDFSSGRLATGFSTGTHTRGYDIQNVTFNIESIDGSGGAGTPRVTIHADTVGKPVNSALYAFECGEQASPGTVTCTSSSSARLSPETLYHAVVSVASGDPFTVSITASDDQAVTDQNNPWTIRNSGNQRGAFGWGRYGSISSGVSNVLKFAVVATKVQPDIMPPIFGAITEELVDGAIQRQPSQGEEFRDRDGSRGSVPLPQATGNPPISYSFIPPLPLGLSFAPSRRIVGTPSVAGTTVHRYIATDADSESSTLSVMLRIIIDPQSGLSESFTENTELLPTDSNAGLSDDVDFFTNIANGRNHPDHTSTNPQQNRGLIARQDGTDIVVEIEPVAEGFNYGAADFVGNRASIGRNDEVLYEVFLQKGVQDDSDIVGGPRYFSATGPDGTPNPIVVVFDASGFVSGAYKVRYEIDVSDVRAGQLEVGVMYVANVAPVFAQSPPVGPVTVPENATAVGAPGLFAATDADSEDEVTYSLSGADASLFNISAGTLMFKQESAPNFEIRNTHEVTVVATGGAGNRALSIMRTITINITDVNEPPAFTSAPAGSAGENAVATTFTAAAADPDADDTTAVVYSIDKTDATTGGADRDRFAIDSSTGVLTFNVGDAPDFEHPRGSPLDAVSNTNDYEVIVTAASGAGDRAMQSTQTVTVNVTDVNDAPVLAPITPPAFTAGMAGAFTITATDEDSPAQTLTFTLTGSDMFGAGITAGGEFSWTPEKDDVGVERMFTVEVADSASPPLTHSTPFTITAAAQDLAFPAVGVGVDPGSMTSATIFYPTGAAITNTTWPAAIGGTGTVTYAMPDGVPRGLTFDAGTRVLSGTPDAPTAPFNVPYTATDSASPPASVSIAITFATCDTGGAADGGTVCSPPAYTTLALTPPPDQTYTINQQLAPPLTLPPATGGTGTNPTRIYSIIPVPPGLIFDPATRVLSDKPSVSGSFTITYEVRDAGSPPSVGRSATTTFPITVEANTAPVFAAGASIDDQSYIANSPITALALPQATGGNGTITYTLTPAIPGLTLNPTSRVLTGTPTTAATSAQHTYTATDTDDDSVTLTFDIVVAEDLAPEFDTATAADQSFTVGVAVALTLPGIISNTGNISISYTLTPPLPAGLTFNAGVRPQPTITGTPTTVTASAEYTLVVTDGDGNTAPSDTDMLTFNLIVNPAPDTDPVFAADDASFSVPIFNMGQAITPLTLPQATAGNAPLTYTLTPTVPGLTLHPTTRVLTGTPTTVAAATDYTYTVTDMDDDTATLMFSITVEVMGRATGLSLQLRDGSTVIRDVREGDTQPITVLVTPSPAGNAFATAQQVTFTLTPPPARPASAADPFVGYEAVEPRTITFPAGSAETIEFPFTLTTLEDNFDHANFHITVTVTAAPSGITETAMIGLLDDDVDILLVPPEITVVQGETVTYTVMLSERPSANVTMIIRSLSPGTAILQFGAQTTAEATQIFSSANTGMFSWAIPRTYAVTGRAVGNTTIRHTASPIHPANYVTAHLRVRVIPRADAAPVFTNAAAFATPISVAENQSVVAGENYFAASETLGDDLTLGGADAGFFTLSPTGTLTFDDPPNFERPRGMAFDAAGNTNNYALTVTAVNSSGMTTGNFAVRVTDVNDAPVLAPITPPGFMVGSPGTITITATDEDIPAQTLIYILAANAVGATLSGNTFTWTPGNNDGTVERMFSVTVTDSGSPPATTTATFTITAVEPVNRVPSFGPISVFPQTYIVGRMITPVHLPVVITPGNGATTYALTPPAGLSFDPATRGLSGTPTTAAPATDYAYTAADADANTSPGDTATLFFSITVNPDIVLSVEPAAVTESTAATNITFTATLVGTFAAERVIRLRLAAGTATAADYAAASVTNLTIPAEMTTATATIPFTAPIDASDDGETVIITADLLDAVGTVDTSIPIPPVTLTIRDYASVSADAGVAQQTALPGSTVTLGGRIVRGPGAFTPGGLVTTWTLVDGDSVVEALKFVGGMTQEEAETEVERLAAELALITTPTGTFTATSGVLGSLIVRLRFTATDAAAPAGQPRSLTTSSDTLSLVVQQGVPADTPPAFADEATIDDQEYFTGSAVNLTLPGATGGNRSGNDFSINYTLTPALPAGLTFNLATFSSPPTITGIPTAAAGPTMYTYRAADRDANTALTDTDMLTFSITVTENLVPTFGDATLPDLLNLIKDSRFEVFLPLATGGNGALTYSLFFGNTDLVACRNCSLNGVRYYPSSRSVRARLFHNTFLGGGRTFHWIANDADGNSGSADEARLTFRVSSTQENLAPAFGAGASIDDQTYIAGTAITPLTLPEATGGNGPITYSIVDTLPTGLTYNRAARPPTITGTPTFATATTMYTHTANDRDGDRTPGDTATLTFSITVVAPTPPAFRVISLSFPHLRCEQPD